MKRLVLSVVCALGLSLGAGASAQTAQEDTQDGPLASSVTAETLEGRIAEVEADAGLPDEVRTDLLELYRRALSYQGETSAHAARAAGLEEATRTAPAQTALIRDELEASRRTDPTASLGVGRRATREQLEQALIAQQADLARAETRRADFEERLAYQRDRPGAIGPRLEEAKRQQEEAATALQAPSAARDSPALAEARRWVLEARYASLVGEITSLEQELRSQPLRVGLLEARRDREAVAGGGDRGAGGGAQRARQPGAAARGGGGHRPGRGGPAGDRGTAPGAGPALRGQRRAHHGAERDERPARRPGPGASGGGEAGPAGGGGAPGRRDHGGGRGGDRGAGPACCSSSASPFPMSRCTVAGPRATRSDWPRRGCGGCATRPRPGA